jgi:hypothetical protein
MKANSLTIDKMVLVERYSLMESSILATSKTIKLMVLVCSKI